MEKDLNKLTSYLKEKGFIYPNSAIYGGLANSFDFGPLGALVKDNLKKEWINYFIKKNTINSYQLDSGIFLNSKVWKTSGHVDKFNDPLIDCKKCKSRYRADHLLEEKGINPSGKSLDDLTKLIEKHKIKCSNCKDKTDFTNVRNFELMFKTSMSKTATDEEVIYLRPETAQGVFVNFKNVVNSQNPKLPFAIGQIGKAFRNEVTPGNFIFRTKEFEQMEYEYFTSKERATKDFDMLIKMIDKFLAKFGLNKKDLKKYDVPKEDLAHYSSRTIDYQYKFPFGFSELLGLANRTDFDLSNHTKFSNEELIIRDEKNNKVTPYILEASFGVERLLLAILLNAYTFDAKKNREVLSLPYSLTPYKVSICPLANVHTKKAKELHKLLLESDIDTIKLDETGSIGKRYYRNDSIGTKFVITVDDNTLKKGVVTIRERDSAKQESIKISKILEYIKLNAK